MLSILITSVLDVLFFISLFLTAAFIIFALAITRGSRSHRVASESDTHPSVDKTAPIARRAA